MRCYGQRLKTVRLLRGYTLKDVATAIGVQEATIQRYESGQIKDIPQERLTALTEHLGTTLEYLIGIGTDDSYEQGENKFFEQMLSLGKNSSENIKKRRLELGINCAELAARANVSKQTIYRYESGKAGKISPRNLRSLSRALRTSIAYITGVTNDPLDISPDVFSTDAIYSAWAQADDSERGTWKSSHVGRIKANDLTPAEDDLIVLVREVCNSMRTVLYGHYEFHTEADEGYYNSERNIRIVSDFITRNADMLQILFEAADAKDRSR